VRDSQQIKSHSTTLFKYSELADCVLKVEKVYESVLKDEWVWGRNKNWENALKVEKVCESALKIENVFESLLKDDRSWASKTSLRKFSLKLDILTQATMQFFYTQHPSKFSKSTNQ
jgi:hypothetical protein